VKQTMIGFLLPVFGVFEGAIINGEWRNVSTLYKVLEVLGAVLVIGGVGLVTLNFRELFGGEKKTDSECKDISSIVSGNASPSAAVDTEETPLLA